MKKNRPRGGVRICARMLLYSFAFIALMGTREFMSGGNGPVSSTLGRVFNEALMASSKLGLGLAMMNLDAPGENTMIGRYSSELGAISHRGFVNSAKVDIYVYGGL
ncbi:MAG: hypothetical protein EOP83_29575 [Verrucomicrobiaceae bacterium]|nr:MAG: hypothetical protein EOP83_29575 [Verrucomicrobiaceae bacterium]